jgi:hypothetical protein
LVFLPSLPRGERGRGVRAGGVTTLKLKAEVESETTEVAISSEILELRRSRDTGLQQLRCSP